MTYPLELREGTKEWDTHYPIRIHRNRASASLKDDVILSLHWHESFEIIDMQAGRAVFHIDSHPYEAQEGDLLFVPSGGLHIGYSTEDGPVEYVAIVFDGALVSKPVHDPVYDRYIVPYLDGRASLPVKIRAEEAEEFYLRPLVREITSELERRDDAYQLVVKHKMELLFALLARRFLPRKLAEKRPTTRNAEPFKPLVEHIRKHYDEPLSIEQAARMVNLNPYYFCKIFKKLTGRTFVDYVNGHRMNEAERMLLHSDLNVTEIAERVGCGNANYFTKLYKKYKGMPPSQALRS
ncbi:helix-turn-helix transcriptional regulator [Cohnella lupini]|uniref:AraC-like protein n=1 Tax=Cohnella lupini TaxID=1294267 RepID=A0A3D9IJE7_9BACL|nr:AraC family transcriptional regulator [Cohnella lupini]RED61777.1 AraC-like protein [Cohnella lupini]